LEFFRETDVEKKWPVSLGENCRLLIVKEAHKHYLPMDCTGIGCLRGYVVIASLQREKESLASKQPSNTRGKTIQELVGNVYPVDEVSRRHVVGKYVLLAVYSVVEVTDSSF